MKNNTKEQKNIVSICLLVGSVLLFLLFLYINLVQYKYGLNADIASEGMLAKVIWDSKEWVPREWYSSTETRVLSPVNIAAVFYGMTKDICFSMGLASIIGMVFVLLGARKLCQELEFQKEQQLWFLFLILLFPNSKNIIELMYLFAGYYAPHVALYFFAMSQYLKLLKGKNFKWYSLVLLWSCIFLLGMQGVRIILIATGPMLATEIVRVLHCFYLKKTWTRKEKGVMAYVLSLNIVALVGGKMPMSVDYPLSRNIRKAPQKFFDVVLPDFLNCFDWNNISVIEKIIFLGMLLFSVGMVGSIIWKGIKKQEIAGSEWTLLNFCLSVCLTIAALTFTTVDSSSRYFIVIFFVMALVITKMWKQSSRLNKGIVLLVSAIILMGNLVRVYYPMVVDKSYETCDYVKVGEYLIAENYENGYTNFDHANSFTVANDGKIQVSAVSSFANIEICKWLTSKKWYVPNVPMESKTAYIISEHRLEEFESFLQEHKDTIEFKTKIGEFNIYGSEYNYSKLAD